MQEPAAQRSLRGAPITRLRRDLSWLYVYSSTFYCIAFAKLPLTIFNIFRLYFYRI